MTTDAERIQASVARGATRPRAGLAAVVLPVVRDDDRPVGVPAVLGRAAGRPADPADVRRDAGGLGDRPVLLPGGPARRLRLRTSVRDAARAAPRGDRPRRPRASLALVAPRGRTGPDRRPARRRAAGRRQPRLDPDRHDRRAGAADHGDDAAAELVVRGDPGGRRRAGRSVLAVRAEQRRIVRGPARLPVPHRAGARADRPALGLGRRASRVLVGVPGRPVPGWSCGRVRPAGGPSAAVRPPAAAAAASWRPPPTDTIDWARRGRWLLLAAVPSGLLSAVTNFITTDLISAPLLWVVPLAIYLLTFVIAFSERGRRIMPGAEWLAPAAVTLLWVPFGSAAGWPIGPLLLRRVPRARDRRHDPPRPARRGSPVAGAPDRVLPRDVGRRRPRELARRGRRADPVQGRLGVPAAARAGPRGAGRGRGPSATGRPPCRPRPRRRTPGSTCRRSSPARRLGSLPYAGRRDRPGRSGLLASGSLGLEAGVRWLLVGGLILLVGGQPRFLFVSTALVLALAVFVLAPPAVFQDRSFFGVTAVLRPADRPDDDPDERDDRPRRPVDRPGAARDVPGSYYAPHGPLGDVFRARPRPARSRAGRSIGVVGLGSGTRGRLGAAGRHADLLRDRPARHPGRLGPGLLHLAVRRGGPPDDRPRRRPAVAGQVAPATYDVLVLDAFSSDAIPAHLLTTRGDRRRRARPPARAACSRSTSRTATTTWRRRSPAPPGLRA